MFEWISADQFRLNGVDFVTSALGASIEEAEKRGAFWVMKNVELLKLYDGWVDALKPKRIVEIGVAGGGGAVLLKERYQPEAVSMIDIKDVTSPRFKDYYGKNRDVLKAHLDIDQSDQDRIDAAVQQDFDGQKPDLVIDDASHLYEYAVPSFETLFPQLPPGGLYIIEDWGWSHWAGDYWQDKKAPWASRVGLSKLVMQLVMASASKPEWVARLLVTQAGTVIERGAGEIPSRTLISDYYLNRGYEGLDREVFLGAPIRLGQRLRFTADKPTDLYLRSGWSRRESWGVWSIGRTASLVLPVENPDPAAAHELRLALVAYVPPEAPERIVSAEIGNVEVARWTFSAPRNTYEETIRLPPGTLEPGEPLRISFRINKPLAPSSLGGSSDNRTIGLGLSWLEIRKSI